ncbi:MAG: hypothetical protein M1826_005684 [Phylliscum demangeonii]|nr:MAG: hypothetical protein M1826_005684 [Phylliscum demangeonii]
MRGSPAFVLAALPLLLVSVMAVPLPRPAIDLGAASGATALVVGTAAWSLHRHDKEETLRRHEQALQLRTEQILKQSNDRLDDLANHSHSTAEKLRAEINTLQEQVTRGDAHRRSAAVDNVLRQHQELKDCLRPFLEARHAITSEILVKTDDWNDAADHCDSEHHHPLLRVEMDYLFLPSLAVRPSPPMNPSQAPSQFSTRPVAGMVHWTQKLGSSAQHMSASTRRLPAYFSRLLQKEGLLLREEAVAAH